MKKIFIAVPTYENISPETFRSIYDLDVGDNMVMFNYVRGYDVATARNKIAQQALVQGADYVLMVDSDVVLPHTALIDLLDEPKDICIGYYAFRPNEENISKGETIALVDGRGNTFKRIRDDEFELMRQAGKTRIPITACGLGCALINVDVFNRLPFPWFKFEPVNNVKVINEDMWFCMQCNEAGIDIFADPRVNCGHIFKFVREAR